VPRLGVKVYILANVSSRQDYKVGEVKSVLARLDIHRLLSQIHSNKLGYSEAFDKN
jgi:hypothetical protein